MLILILIQSVCEKKYWEIIKLDLLEAVQQVK